MRRFIFCCTSVFHIVLGAAIGHAQTVDPSILEFDPSAYHASSVVSGYELRIRVAGSSPIVQAVSLGKPAIAADGKIRVSLAAILDSYPNAGAIYDASVAAVGATGEGLSAPSNTFSFSPCEFTVTPDQQTVVADAGTFSVLVNARNGCSWGAGAGAAWLSLGSNGGNGTGAADFSVQGNATGTQRTSTVMVAGRPIAVLQLATSAMSAAATLPAAPAPPPAAPINLRVLH